MNLTTDCEVCKRRQTTVQPKQHCHERPNSTVGKASGSVCLYKSTPKCGGNRTEPTVFAYRDHKPKTQDNTHTQKPNMMGLGFRISNTTHESLDHTARMQRKSIKHLGRRPHLDPTLKTYLASRLPKPNYTLQAVGCIVQGKA